MRLKRMIERKEKLEIEIKKLGRFLDTTRGGNLYLQRDRDIIEFEFDNAELNAFICAKRGLAESELSTINNRLRHIEDFILEDAV